jgi:NAD(P)-dependent dehydrogenase (short-subunit alcohol dehydrogenase family)
MKQMKNLENKTAVITGGSGGIGLATVKLLKERGAKVLFTGRNSESISSVAKSTGTIGIVSDQSDLAEIDKLVKRASQELGKVDILYINAGTLKTMPIEQVTEEIFDEFIKINQKGIYFTIQKFLPILNDNAIIILISGGGTKSLTSPGSSLHIQAKSAVNSMARTLVTELAPRGIRINVILGAAIETDLMLHAGVPKEKISQTYEKLKEIIPVKRTGKPQDVANLVAFLASDEASYINGVEYVLDGGFARKAVF